MRDYSTISPLFWTGTTGKKLRKSPEAMIIALYLMTSPHANMLGLYYMPTLFMAHETGLGIEGASKGLQSCIEAGFCAFDEASEMVWVFEMARFQIAPELKPADNRVKGIQKEYESLPDNPYLARFYDKYHQAFCMSKKRGSEPEITNPSEAPCDPLLSQEQEQEQEQEQDHKKHTSGSDVSPSSKPSKTDQFVKPAREVFEYWLKIFNKRTDTLFDDKRKTKVLARLKQGYTVEQLKQAIDGCSRSDFHVSGGHTDLELICREPSKTDKFIELSSQPVPGMVNHQYAEQLSRHTPLSAERSAELTRQFRATVPEDM